MAKVGDMNLTTEETKEHKNCDLAPEGCFRVPHDQCICSTVCGMITNKQDAHKYCSLVYGTAVCSMCILQCNQGVYGEYVQCSMCNVQFAVQLFRGKPALRATRLQIERLHSFHSRFGLLMRMMMIRIHNDHHHHHQTLDVSCAPCAH